MSPGATTVVMCEPSISAEYMAPSGLPGVPMHVQNMRLERASMASPSGIAWFLTNGLIWPSAVSSRISPAVDDCSADDRPMSRAKIRVSGVLLSGDAGLLVGGYRPPLELLLPSR